MIGAKVRDESCDRRPYCDAVAVLRAGMCEDKRAVLLKLRKQVSAEACGLAAIETSGFGALFQGDAHHKISSSHIALELCTGLPVET